MKRTASLALPALSSALLLAACAPDATAPLTADAAYGRNGDPGLSVGAGTIAIVTRDADAGKGSLREAIAMANADARIVRIEIKPEARTIALTSSIVYTGAQPLTIIGKRATLDARDAGGPALIANGGGDLHIEALTVANAPSEGLVVEVPSNATGTLRVTFRDVAAIGNAGHGILVNDQVDPSTSDGVQPNAGGSSASLDVSLTGVRLLDNGDGASDRDGIRVNEGGEGSLRFTARHVRSEDNGADGIELDERGAGDVIVDVRETRILRNGALDEADLDDGFDIDEYDAGSILGTLRDVTANDNYEEGLDFNENNAGDLRVDLFDVEASGNREEGIDYEEDDDFAGGGDLVSVLRGVIANGNGVDDGDGGLKIREKGAGDLQVDVTDVTTLGNLVAGISIREDADGRFIARLTDGVSTGNTGAGLSARQQAPGTAVLELRNVITSPNAGGAFAGNVPPTIVP